MTSKGTQDMPSEALALVGISSSEARARLDSWRRTAVQELTERPVRTLSLALGAGYLLGGGLFSRLTWRLARFGLRFGLPTVLGLLDGEDGDGEDGDAASAPTYRVNQSTKRDLGTGKRKNT
jgi:hypothetical protein